jgi:predicted transcriptional regulator
MNYIPSIIGSLSVSVLFSIIVRNIYTKLKQLEDTKVNKEVCEKEHGRVDEKFIEDKKQLEKIHDCIAAMNTNITKLTTMLQLKFGIKDESSKKEDN